MFVMEFFLGSKQLHKVFVKDLHQVLYCFFYTLMTYNVGFKVNHPHFVDDNNLIFSSENIETIESVINNELRHLVQWLRGNKLSLNETKTKLIILERLGSNYRENLILALITVNSHYILMLNIQEYPLMMFSREINKQTFILKGKQS